MKWKILLFGLLTIGLLAGGGTAVLAQSASQPGAEPAASFAQEVSGELNSDLETEIIPTIEEGDKLSIDGGFRGIWGTESEADQLSEHTGYITGLYGSVTKADGTAYGFMGGVYTSKDGRLGGFLSGKYADGSFWGTWRSATGETTGQYKGNYNVNTCEVESVLNCFRGKWQTSDGERTGYMKGSYSPKVSIHMTGRFGGGWAINNDEADISEIIADADGSLKGHYGVIRFADGASINYFRGGWMSDEGCARGRIQGIAIRGQFYGVWHNIEGKPAGYLSGKYGENMFRGVWGNMGEEPRGNLWGRYGQIPEAEEDIQLAPDEVILQTLTEEDQL